MFRSIDILWKDCWFVLFDKVILCTAVHNFAWRQAGGFIWVNITKTVDIKYFELSAEFFKGRKTILSPLYLSKDFNSSNPATTKTSKIRLFQYNLVNFELSTFETKNSGQWASCSSFLSKVGRASNQWVSPFPHSKSAIILIRRL